MDLAVLHFRVQSQIEQIRRLRDDLSGTEWPATKTMMADARIAIEALDTLLGTVERMAEARR